MNKVKFTDSPGVIRNVAKSSPGNKLIVKLDHDCLAKVLMHIPVVERLEMENGKFHFL